MICKKCKNENKAGTLHCINCGYELVSNHFSIKKLLIYSTISLAILVWVAVSFFPLSQNQTTATEKKEISSAIIGKTEKENYQKLDNEVSQNFERIDITYASGEIKTFQTYMSRQNIAAIPLSLIKSASSITCGEVNNKKTIETYFWDTDNNVVFINLPFKDKDNFLNKAYKIGDWTAANPFYLFSSDSKTPTEIKLFKIIEKQGDLLVIESNLLQKEAPSIIVQDDELVGWVFPSMQKSIAYLWLGEERALPSDEPVIPSAILYLLCSNKDSLAKKLDSLDKNVLSQYLSDLVLFMKKNDKNNADYIRKVSFLTEAFCVRLTEIGSTREIADRLDPEIVAMTDNKNTLEIFAQANVSIYGYGKAIDLLNDVLAMNKSTDSFRTRTYAIISGLYIDWIESLIVKDDNTNAKSVCKTALLLFPDNQKIRLLEAEIYLKFGDWEKAESIIQSMNFDAKFIPEVKRIKEIIADIKSSENKIIIEFEPNPTNTIFLDAIINGNVRQKFIVDTGATLVSIPSKTAASLNIAPSACTEKTISTASGIFRTKEVILDSITINNRKISNIQAVIIDLPDDQGIGLLGMSFLNKFHVELNNTAGKLLLTPKEIN